MDEIYFDNASTTFPKPENVLNEVSFFLKEIGGSAGRASHSKAKKSLELLYSVRKNVSKFFNVKNEDNIFFTLNASYASNLILKGFIKSPKKVLITNYEHNSIYRPLYELNKKGLVELEFLNFDFGYKISNEEINKKIDTFKPDLVCLNAVSNVTGNFLNLEEICLIIKKRSIPIFLDTAQGAGIIDIDISKLGVSFFIFTGHKGLYGIQGCGGGYVDENYILNTIIEGGTGSLSENESMPDFFPDRFEVGTLNLPAIISLSPGIDFINKITLNEIRKREIELSKHFWLNLKNEDIIFYGDFESFENRIGIISINCENLEPDEFSYILDDEYNICTRSGLHCSPLSHKTLGTNKYGGTVRFSFSYFNTIEEVDMAINSILEIIKRR